MQHGLARPAPATHKTLRFAGRALETIQMKEAAN
jgi:hypothetical protein